MCDLVTTLYIFLYKPCKHPYVAHKCLHNEQVRIFLMMDTKAFDCSNNPYVGRRTSSMFRTKIWNETLGVL
jgi:hypothetical protein